MKRLLIFNILILFAFTGCKNNAGTTSDAPPATVDISKIDTRTYEDKKLGFKVTYPAIFSKENPMDDQIMFYDPTNTDAVTTIATDPTENMTMDEIITKYGIIEEDIIERSGDRLVLNGLSHKSTADSVPYYCIVTRTDDIIIWVNIMMKDTDVKKYESICPALNVELI